MEDDEFGKVVVPKSPNTNRHLNFIFVVLQKSNISHKIFSCVSFTGQLFDAKVDSSEHFVCHGLCISKTSEIKIDWIDGLDGVVR